MRSESTDRINQEQVYTFREEIYESRTGFHRWEKSGNSVTLMVFAKLVAGANTKCPKNAVHVQLNAICALKLNILYVLNGKREECESQKDEGCIERWGTCNSDSNQVFQIHEKVNSLKQMDFV